MAVYATGHGWTGALGLGREAMVDGAISEGDLVGGGEGNEELVPVHRLQGQQGPRKKQRTACSTVAAAAAGWGHSAYVVQSSSAESSPTSLLIAGRPHDFQTLLRLRRLPAFLRQYIVKNSLRYDDGTVRPNRDEVRAARGAVAGLIDMFMSSGSEEREKMLEEGHEDLKKRYGLFPTPTEILLPGGDEPAVVGTTGAVLAASAGLTAIVGKSGTLYTFGLNHRGQCGVGRNDRSNIWDPQPVAGLNLDFPHDNDINKDRSALKQETPIVSVALGLQHGLALNDRGQIFSWGKGSRGQLGVPDPGQTSTQVFPDTEYSGVPVTMFCPDLTSAAVLTSLNKNDGLLIRPMNDQILTGEDAKVTSISAGMNQSAAITASNHAWIWGKNICAYDHDSDTPSPQGGKYAEDATLPTRVNGLPPDLAIIDVACGSHHTSFLLEDGSVYSVGVATDTVRPISAAVEIIPPGIIDMPPRQFTSHFDRTTIVGKDGNQVLEVQLWSHEELRDGAAFEPGWVDAVLADLERKGVDKGGVQAVHKGWMHTIVVADD